MRLNKTRPQGTNLGLLDMEVDGDKFCNSEKGRNNLGSAEHLTGTIDNGGHFNATTNRDHLLSRTEMVAQRSEYSTANKSKEYERETKRGQGDIRRVARRQEGRRAGR